MGKTEFPRNYEKTCIECGKPFFGIHNQMMCSKECYDKKAGIARFGKIDSGKVGAISELEVSQDWMKNGWEGYRSLSQSSSSDLMAYKDGVKLLFEVRTAYWRARGGGVSCNTQKCRSDILAAVLPDHVIVYVSKGFKNLVKGSNSFNLEKLSEGGFLWR